MNRQTRLLTKALNPLVGNQPPEGKLQHRWRRNADQTLPQLCDICNQKLAPNKELAFFTSYRILTFGQKITHTKINSGFVHQKAAPPLLCAGFMQKLKGVITYDLSLIHPQPLQS
jgi:hypothetical protein